MASETMQLDGDFPSLTICPTPESSWFETRTFRFYNGAKVLIGRTDGLEEIGGEVRPNSSNGIFTEKVISRKHASLFFRVGRFYLEDQNSAHGTKVNGEKLHKFSAYKLTDGDILTFGRSGYYRGVEFKAVIGKISLAYPCFDSLVPSSMDQVPMKEVEGKKVPRMEVPRKEEISISDSINDRTLSLESLIGALEKEENRSPKTDRKLVGLKEALHYKKEAKLSTKQAVSLVSILTDLSPGNSPGSSPVH